MLISSNAKIFLYREAIDFRKSYDSLILLVEHILLENPTSGAYFIFCNSSRNRIKILYWDLDGFAIWMKRLERGSFVLPDQLSSENSSKQQLNFAIYNALLNGVEISKKYKRFQLKNS